MACLDRYVPESWRKEDSLWNHPAGPKTIFFWAPCFKWGLVIAGLKDLARAAIELSVWQSLALALTGWIWSRYCLVITPKNWFLFAANLFIGITQTVQVGRAIYAKYYMEPEVEQQTEGTLIDFLLSSTLGTGTELNSTVASINSFP